jgi:hypothetical protein
MEMLNKWPLREQCLELEHTVISYLFITWDNIIKILSLITQKLKDGHLSMTDLNIQKHQKSKIQVQVSMINMVN